MSEADQVVEPTELPEFNDFINRVGTAAEEQKVVELVDPDNDGNHVFMKVIQDEEGLLSTVEAVDPLADTQPHHGETIVYHTKILADKDDDSLQKYIDGHNLNSENPGGLLLGLSIAGKQFSEGKIDKKAYDSYRKVITAKLAKLKNPSS